MVKKAASIEAPKAFTARGRVSLAARSNILQIGAEVKEKIGVIATKHNRYIPRKP